MRLHRWFNQSPPTTLQTTRYTSDFGGHARHYGTWYSIPLAEHSHHSESFIYQANFETILGILEREVSGGLWKLKRGLYGSRWLILHGAIQCPALIDALESLEQYACLDDDRLSELEHDSALNYWERDGSDEHVNSCLQDYGVEPDQVLTIPPENTWSLVSSWESSPVETRITFHASLSDLLSAGLTLTIDGVRNAIDGGLSQAELVALCNSHSHFTDEELGLSSESARLLREIASQNNPNQGKLF